MDSFEQDQLRARTDAFQGQVDTMLAGYEQQLRDIADARDTLAAATALGWSSDNLVRANSAGVPIDVWIDPGVFKRSTPERLGASMTEAAQVAARAAKARIDAVLAPITGAAAAPEVLLAEYPELGRHVDSILPPPSAHTPVRQLGTPEPDGRGKH